MLTPDVKLATGGGCQIDLHRHFTCASSRPTQWWRKLYRARKRANSYPVYQVSAAFLACSMQISCSRQWMLWMRRPRTGVCKPLMPDVVAPEAHLNNFSYVRELSWPTFGSLSKNLARCVVTLRTSKKTNTKLPKLGGGCLPGTIRPSKNVKNPVIYIKLFYLQRGMLSLHMIQHTITVQVNTA